MARPGFLAEDTAAKNALAQEAELARRVAQNRVLPSQALTVANGGGAKPPVPVQAQNSAAPAAPRALPASPTTARITPYQLPAPAAQTPVVRPTLSLTSGNIPNAINRINAPSSQAGPTASATLNAANGVPSLNAPVGVAPKVPITQGPTIYAAPGQAGSTADPQLAKQIQEAIEQQAKQRASIAASGANASTGTASAVGTPQPGVAARALNAAKPAASTLAGYGSKLLQGAARYAPVLTAGAEALSAYNDATTEGMTGMDKTARGLEAVGRVTGTFAGAGVGGSVGALGGPLAPVTVPLGGVVGGIAGLLAPEMANDAMNRMLGTDTELASQKAAGLQQAQKNEEGIAMQNALLTPEQLAARESAAEAAKTPAEAAAIRSGEIPTFLDGAGVTPAPTNEQRAAAKQIVQEQRLQSAAPASAALSNANAPQAPQQTASPEKYAEISGYDGPKKNVNRRYSLEELTKLGERNVIPSASFTNPGAGVALSEVSGGRANLAFGQANPIKQYQNEVSSAQARNRATYERATAAQQSRQGGMDDTERRLLSAAESALGSGKKRQAAGLTDLLRAYAGARAPGAASNALSSAQKPPMTDQEQALATLKLQQEGSSADILQIQAGQAKQVANLQAAMLSAPPEEQAAIKAQLDMVMGRQTQQAKPEPGAITPKDQFADLGRQISAELDPEKKAELIVQQKALLPQSKPPVEGAQLAPDGKWYVQQNGKYVSVSN